MKTSTLDWALQRLVDRFRLQIASEKDWFCKPSSYSKTFFVGALLNFIFCNRTKLYRNVAWIIQQNRGSKIAEVENQSLGLPSDLIVKEVKCLVGPKMLATPAPCMIAIRKTSNSMAHPSSRRVSFSNLVQVQTMDLRSMIPREDFEATWYSRIEFLDIKRSNNRTIEKMTK